MRRDGIPVGVRAKSIMDARKRGFCRDRMTTFNQGPGLKTYGFAVNPGTKSDE